MRTGLVLLAVILAGCTQSPTVSTHSEPPEDWETGEVGNITRRFVASTVSTPNVIYTPVHSIQEQNCFTTTDVEMEEVPRAVARLFWDNQTPYEELRLVGHGYEAVGGSPLKLVMKNLTVDGNVVVHVLPPLEAGVILAIPTRINLDVTYLTDSRADPNIRPC